MEMYDTGRHASRIKPSRSHTGQYRMRGFFMAELKSKLHSVKMQVAVGLVELNLAT
jgi:hypothetical protein